jgi:hypothetical protein
MVVKNWLHLDMIWSRVIETYGQTQSHLLRMAWIWFENAVINHRCDQWLYNGRLLDTKFEWLFDFGN